MVAPGIPRKRASDWAEVCARIRRAVFEAPGFRTCTLRLPPGRPDGHARALLRPVAFPDGRTLYQLTLTGGRAADVANHERRAATAALDGLLDAATEAHATNAVVELHARRTRTGRVLISQGRPTEAASAAPAHDREKEHPLAAPEFATLRAALGFADAQDRLRPSMQAKFRQVNAFLRIIDGVLSDDSAERPLRILDAGCGKAYLAFAAQAWFSRSRGRRVYLTGVDRRDDVVLAARATAERLGLQAPEAVFAVADIARFVPEAEPDLVLSLHACGAATDEALARGVEWGARAIVCAPCCQHAVQPQLATDGPHRALLRHGILRERLADMLADAFRAQLLRVLGYRVRVVEFVAPDATSRNLLIRATRGVRPGMAEAVAEYLALRDAWRVTPPLETRLSARLRGLLPGGPDEVPRQSLRLDNAARGLVGSCPPNEDET